MREIKFRAWDVFYKKFVVSDVDDQGMEVFWLMVRHGKQAGREVPVMQFTGLKDKNGKEIYQGDVVQIKKRDRIWRDEVAMRNGSWSIADYNCQYCADAFGNNEWIEVIGNIYENPELLTTK